MIYSKTTGIGATGVLDAIEAFLVGNGWTTNQHAVDGTGKRLHVSKGSLYFNLRSHTANEHTNNGGGANQVISGLSVNGSTGYDVGQSWDQQPGYPVNNSGYEQACRMAELPEVTVTIWMFLHTAPDTFFCVVEKTPDRFTWLTFGELEKTGTWTGGAFFSAERNRYISDDSSPYTSYGPFETTLTDWYQNFFLYAGYDSFTGWAGSPHDPLDTGTTSSQTGAGVASSIQIKGNTDSIPNLTGTQHIHRLPGISAHAANLFDPHNYEGPAVGMYNTYLGQGVLFPIYLFLRRRDGSYQYSQAGKIKGLKFVDIRNAEVDVIKTIGSTNFRILPSYSKANPQQDPETTSTNTHYGLAFEVN